MKYAKYLSLLILSLSLISCGDGSSSEGVPTFTENGVNQLLGTKTKFKEYLDSFNENVKGFKTVQYHDGDYGETTTTKTTSINSNDLLIVTEQKSVYENEIENTKTTDYTALIENDKYHFYFSEPSNDFDFATKTEVSNEDLTNEQIQMDLLINENGLSAFLQDKAYGWGHIFSEENIEKSYRATIVENQVQVRTKSSGNAVEYLLVATFDNKFNFNEGTLTKNSYRYTDWDEKQQQPKAGALPSSKTTYTLSDLELGRESVSASRIDYSQFFITEIVGDINVYSTYVDQSTFEETISNPNELFKGQYLDTSNLFGEEGFSYLPATALDKDSITITSSTNELALREEEGFWIIGDTVGAKTTVTIGNDSNPNMASVELTVVDLPNAVVDDKPLPVYTTEYPIYDPATSTELPLGKTIDMKLGQAKRYCLPTVDAGPFGGLDKASITYSDNTIVNVSLAQCNFDGSAFSYYWVHIDVEALNVGSTSVTFTFRTVEFVTITINVAA